MSVRERIPVVLTKPGNFASEELLGDIVRRFAGGFPEETPPHRTVGREAEFPLVDDEGRAADASRLWPILVSGGDVEAVYDEKDDGSEFIIGVRHERWTCVIEVGKGTVEISVGPRDTLHELAGDFDAAMGRVGGAARGLGLSLLGYGIQPVSSASESLLTPKRRYRAMLDAIGDGWLAFCMTAGDQSQIDIGRDEIVRMTNIVGAASGALIAVSANSPIYGGVSSGFASARQGIAEGIAGEPNRHGAAPRPYRNLEDYVRFLTSLRCLCLPDPRGGYRLPAGSFMDVLPEFHGDAEAAYEAFLFHEHYVWCDARPRARIGTLEVRPACQQTDDRSWIPSAFSLGLVESADEVEAFFEDSRVSWEELMKYREAAVGLGAAPEPFPGFLEGLVEISRGGLRKRGFGEEEFLAPLGASVTSPAERVRRTFERHGVPGIVREFAVN